MICDRYKRFYLFGEEMSEDGKFIRANLGFYEMDLPQNLDLYKKEECVGNYTLPKNVVGQTFEGVISEIVLYKN